ncbi:MAG: LLM class flavin-dependent oxidoreductase [Pseudomonadota bacterium]
MTVFSLLDLAPITEGSTARQALLNSRDLARHAEQQGYKRFWMAEHHNSSGIASAATAVALGFVAEGTSTIRIGAAGVMLPNHSPLVIAEQFGTLASLYPDRVDLGLGRAPGTDGKTMQALRRENVLSAADRFPQDVMELRDYFDQGFNGIKAVPGHGLQVPLWILGSSLFGAQLAAHLGLPYLFASHFAPDHLHTALQVYRDRFQPSPQHPEPYVGAAVNVFAADTDAEGHYLMSSMQQQFVALRRGEPGPLKPPVRNEAEVGSHTELAQANHALREAAVGSPASVKAWLQQFLARTQVDELILTSHVYDHDARIKSFAIAAAALNP